MISLSVVGLGIITLSWVLEFFLMGKNKKISPFFISAYLLGVSILIYDGFTSQNNLLAVANLVSLIVAGIVLGKTLVEIKNQ